MNPKKIHNLLGIILALPLLGWICTGVIFLLKPGYEKAYEQISLKVYLLDKPYAFQPNNSWTEIRILKTILGEHLLVKVDGEWRHLNFENLRPQPKPTEEQEIALLTDAIGGISERYGKIEGRNGAYYVTSTGVELSLNWNTLNISQSGNDTKLINALYKIHYLQWLGNKPANTVLGVVGLLLLFLLVSYGVVLYLRRRRVAT